MGLRRCAPSSPSRVYTPLPLLTPSRTTGSEGEADYTFGSRSRRRRRRRHRTGAAVANVLGGNRGVE